MELSTELKTASFYYDFHLLEVYQQVVNDNVKLNLSYLLSHLLTNYYYPPPNHSANFIKEIKLRIELGQGIDSAEKFFQFFYDHIVDYEFCKTSSAPAKHQKNQTDLRIMTKQHQRNSFIQQKTNQAPVNTNMAFFLKNRANQKL